MKAQLLNDKDKSIANYLNIYLPEVINNLDVIQDTISFGECEEFVLNETVYSINMLKYLAKFVALGGTLVLVDYDIGLLSHALINGKLKIEELHNITHLGDDIHRPLYMTEYIISHLPNFKCKKISYANMKYTIVMERLN